MRLSINVGDNRGTAFQDGNDFEELLRCAKEALRRIENAGGLCDGQLNDVNGNVCGQFIVAK